MVLQLHDPRRQELDPKTGPKCLHEMNGILWEMRGGILNSNLEFVGVWTGEKVTPESPSSSPLNLTGDINEYTEEIPVSDQDLMVREFDLLTIEKKISSVGGNDLDAPLGDDVWNFINTLAKKLDEQLLPNLFRQNNNSPTTNMLAHMIKNHHLRSTFDFETAVGREFGFAGSSGFNYKNKKKVGVMTWNFRLIDMIAGQGTTAAIIHELKDMGAMRGAKRRLKFNQVDRVCKSARVSELEECISRLNLGENTHIKKVSLVDKMAKGDVYNLKKKSASPVNKMATSDVYNTKKKSVSPVEKMAKSDVYNARKKSGGNKIDQKRSVKRSTVSVKVVDTVGFRDRRSPVKSPKKKPMSIKKSPRTPSQKSGSIHKYFSSLPRANLVGSATLDGSDVCKAGSEEKQKGAVGDSTPGNHV